MIDTIKSHAGWVALVILALIWVGHVFGNNSLGAATTDCTTTTCLQGGLRITSGDFSIASSNTATSTAQVGCIQTTATSTASPIRITFSIQGQNAATTTTSGGTSIGNVVWQFGTCPI